MLIFIRKFQKIQFKKSRNKNRFLYSSITSVLQRPTLYGFRHTAEPVCCRVLARFQFQNFNCFSVFINVVHVFCLTLIVRFSEFSSISPRPSSFPLDFATSSYSAPLSNFTRETPNIVPRMMSEEFESLHKCIEKRKSDIRDLLRRIQSAKRRHRVSFRVSKKKLRLNFSEIQ